MEDTMNRSGMIAGLMLAVLGMAGAACSPAPGGGMDDFADDKNGGNTERDTDGTDPVVLTRDGADAAASPTADGDGGASTTNGSDGSDGGNGGGTTPKVDGAAPAPAPAPTPAPVACPGKSEIEPNDTTANANALAGVTCGKLTAGDVDRYQFDAKDDVMYTLAFDADQGARFRIIRPNGTTLSASGRTVRTSFSGRGGRVEVIVDNSNIAQGYRITFTHD
jgi:hypothetical protein